MKNIEAKLEELREKYRKAPESMRKIILMQVELLKMGQERKYERT